MIPETEKVFTFIIPGEIWTTVEDCSEMVDEGFYICKNGQRKEQHLPSYNGC